MQTMTTRGKVLSKAYIAGLFDGEGCVNIYCINSALQRKLKRNPRWELSATVYNNHIEVLKLLKEEYGGYLQTRTRPDQSWKQSYAWKLSSNKALSFLKDIEPYMIIKRKQARLGIRFQTRKSKKTSRFLPLTQQERKYYHSTWKKMRRLNARGVSPATT